MPKVAASTTPIPGKMETTNDIKHSICETLQNSPKASANGETDLAQTATTTQWEKSGSKAILMDDGASTNEETDLAQTTTTTQWENEIEMTTDTLSTTSNHPRVEENGEWHLVKNTKKAKTQVVAEIEATPLVTAKDKLKQRGEELK